MGGGQRHDYISWDDYFMSIAGVAAMRSKDPSSQVGACIVNKKNRLVGVGYNGFPSGISDSSLPWAEESEHGELHTKYPYVVPAQINAILNKNAESCSGCTLYCTMFPCNECAKVMIQSGITCVVYLSDKYRDTTSAQASRKMLSYAGVEMRPFTTSRTEITIPLRVPEGEVVPQSSGAGRGACPGTHGVPSDCGFAVVQLALGLALGIVVGLSWRKARDVPI